MSDWISGDVVANGLNLHYVRTGGEKPPLVMAHGHSDNGLCWKRVAKVLEARYDLIMYDARGHGLSDDGPGTRNGEDMASDAAGLIEALGLGKPGMMGHSMGASTSASTAALYPELISYTILEDPAWFNAETMARRTSQRRAQEAAREDPDTREGWLAQYHQRYADAHDDDAEPWADAKMQFSKHVHPQRSPRRTWQEIASKITCPTLLITADPEMGAIVTPEIAVEAMGLMAKGQVVRIEDSGHSIRRNQFGAYMDAVTSFLAEVAP